MFIQRSASVVVGLLLVSAAAARAEIVSSVAVGPRPESITRGFDGKFFVTIQGPSGGLGGPNDFDGEVRQVDLQTGTVTSFASGMENPRGITFTGKFLVVADQKRIFKIDRHGARTVLAEADRFPFPINFFNDAATEEGGRAVYVSEMGRRDLIRDTGTPAHLIPVDSPAAYDIPAISRVYRIPMDGGPITSVFEPSRKLLVINGVTEIKKRSQLLVLDFFHGNVVKVDIKKGTRKILATALRGADGIEQADDGTIFVSSFENGHVWRMDADGENLQFLARDVGFQTTADFYLDQKANLLYVPNTPAGTVMVVTTTP